jgi:GGDEF domain-containing protein
LLSISAGSSFFLDDGTDAEHLLSEADRRMYIMKQIHHAQSDAVQVTSPS